MKQIRKPAILFSIALAAAISEAQLIGREKDPSQSDRIVYEESINFLAFFGLLDQDEDGFTSRPEWMAFFTARDSDGDQSLSRDEMKSALKRAMEPEDSDSGRIAAFERLDANKNNKIDPSEWPGKAKDYRYLDSDHDRFLSLEEFLSPNGRWRKETFTNLDFNGDKVISRSEWLDSDSSFNRLDRDKNGAIDRAEFYGVRSW